jgi:ParB family chromosome partitioning protein
MYEQYVLQKAEDKAFGGKEIKEIAISKLQENPYQPRIEIKQEEVKELANSIKENGLIQPIVVHRDKQGNYIIIAGHRRVEAHKLLGKKFINAIVLKNQKSIQFAKKAIIENLQREDLDLIETAMALKRYKEEFNKTLDEIGKEIGKNKVFVSRILNILNLPEEILRDIKKNKSTKDITSLNLLNSYINKKFRMRNKSQNSEKEVEKIKNEILELYQGFLVNGREWLKKEINKRLKNDSKNKKKDIVVNFGKRKTKIELNIELNDDEIKIIENVLKDLSRKRELNIDIKKIKK